jgi:hypothetical protein
MRAENKFAERMSVFTSVLLSEEEYMIKEGERALGLSLYTSEITTLIDALTGEH